METEGGGAMVERLDLEAALEQGDVVREVCTLLFIKFSLIVLYTLL